TLTLEDCLKIASKQNPQLATAREKKNELVADYEAARSKFFPRLSLVSYYSRLDPDRLGPGGTTNQKLYSQESLNSLTGKQIMFDGLKTYFSTKAAQMGTEAQKEEIHRVAFDVEFSVTEAYYRLVEAREDLNVAKEALRQRQEFVKLTEAFFKAGKVTKLDFFRAQSQVFEAEQSAVEGENAVRLAQIILAQTLGVKEDFPIEISGKVRQEFPPVSGFETLWQQAGAQNPEIKKLDIELSQGKSLIKAAQGNYYPEISLQGEAGVRHRNQGGTEDEWIGGIFMEFPFFEGGLTRANVGKATSQYLQTVETKRSRLDALRVDLRDAFNGLENSRKGVSTARQSIITNTEGYNSSLSLYRHGKATGLDVLQTQVELTASQFSFIRYAVAYEINLSRIKKIIGTETPPFLLTNH
ncbi:MAG: TolC family protein, partial [Proteobacteria bacterium]|nr:TolC family protein [Pseudomonadota bacterium]